jgi:DNA replication protein DnaC
LEIAFDVINRRYNNQKATIISSEIQLGELEKLDKALFGRIKERCGKFSLNIKNEDSRNYRKR